MVIGLGTDLIEIERIERSVKRFGDAFLRRVYTPGEKEFLNRQSYRRDGIPLNATTLADLDAVADELGVVGRTHVLRA